MRLLSKELVNENVIFECMKTRIVQYRYTFAREIVGENEYTTGIELLPFVKGEQREDPPVIHMDIVVKGGQSEE